MELGMILMMFVQTVCLLLIWQKVQKLDRQGKEVTFLELALLVLQGLCVLSLALESVKKRKHKSTHSADPKNGLRDR